MEKRRNLVWVSVCIVLMLALCGLVLPLGGRVQDAYAEAEMLVNGRTRIHTGIVSSVGYVRSMEMTVEGEEAYLDFYRTFGINQSIGARNEFTVSIPREVQRVYIWQYGEYRLLCVRGADGGWEKAN